MDRSRLPTPVAAALLLLVAAPGGIEMSLFSDHSAHHLTENEKAANGPFRVT